jgi:SanA protein
MEAVSRLATWRMPRISRPSKKGVLIGIGAMFSMFLLGIALIAAINAYILFSTKGEATSVIADVPHAQVAIVPGAQVRTDGTMSGMLAERVSQAAALYKAGKVDRILVSGDHHSWAYDEPDTMRKSLVAAGIPKHVIFEDHAGFDTWASMVRARKIFDVSSAVVVTQGFHMPRALYEAHEAGLSATGLTADRHSWGEQGRRSAIREIFARVKAIYDTSTNAAVMSGPQIPITGDGRASWGPAPPNSTPPAGSPGR